jgi:hypothetical protein
MEKAMKVLRIPPHSKKSWQIILLLTIVLLNLAPMGTFPVYAISPVNDKWQDAIAITIPFNASVDTTDANQEIDEPELDIPQTCEGARLRAGLTTIWYKYVPLANALVSLDTLGSNQSVINPDTNTPYEYDTYIAVWTGTPSTSPTLVSCNDDNAAGFRSQLGFHAVAGTTYYIQVAQYNGKLNDVYVAPPYQGGNLKFHAGYSSQTEIHIGGNLQGSYEILSQSSARKLFPLNNGPVKVISANNVTILDSMRVIFGGVSYSEMMGFPANKLTNEYLFPYYNNVAMDSQLRVSNLGAVPTTITVYLAGSPIDSYSLAAGAATRKNYPDRNNGPLRVTSSATNILTTIRVLFGGTSYSELTGFPANQLTTQYLFPYYNNVAMDSQLRVSNMGAVPTTITVSLAGSPIDSYTLAAGAATRKNYPGRNNGPLQVTSSATNILTTIRVLYNGQSFSELLGFPANQLTTTYWYPAYDNVNVDAQLRVSNVGGVATTITVYLAGTPIDTYTLAVGAATRKNYSELNNGPLRVVSSASNILSTQRLLYTTPSFGSFYEITGVPNNQLTTQYWFPWYNNAAMVSQIRIATP